MQMQANKRQRQTVAGICIIVTRGTVRRDAVKMQSILSLE